MALELSHVEYGAGPPLVILHGLFGSARNWASIAKRLGETHRIFVLDLRNHGASPSAATMSYREMAADVAAFMERHGLAGATVMGHSMGGKTAMMLALEQGEAVGRLIVVDIAPAPYGHSHLPIIRAMQRADLSAARRRSEVDGQLDAEIPDPALRGFLLQNLVSEEGRLAWRINLEALADNMETLTGFPDDVAAHGYHGPVLFLAGGRSEYVELEHHGEIGRLFPAADIDAVPTAGHWVHAEDPTAFLARVEVFLKAAP
jgi:pimeloyl-ACP methyl ester carboxylesterase